MRFKFFTGMIFALALFQSAKQAESVSEPTSSAQDLQEEPRELRQTRRRSGEVESKRAEARSQAELGALRAVHNIFSSPDKRKLMAAASVDAESQNDFLFTSNEDLDDADMESTNVVEEQKRLLLLQFYEVINESREDPSIMDQTIVKLLTNYLQHLEYIYVKEAGDQDSPPPVLYNYQTDQEIASYCESPSVSLPDESFLNEDQDEFVDLFDEYNSNNLGIIRKVEQLKHLRRVARKTQSNNKDYFDKSPSSLDPLNRPDNDRKKYKRNQDFNEHELEDFKQMAAFYSRELRKLFRDARSVQKVADSPQFSPSDTSFKATDASNQIFEAAKTLRYTAIHVLMEMNRFLAVMQNLDNRINTVSHNFEGVLYFYEDPELVNHIHTVRPKTGGKWFPQENTVNDRIDALFNSFRLVQSVTRELRNTSESFAKETLILRRIPLHATNFNQANFKAPDLKITLERFNFYRNDFVSRLKTIVDRLEHIQRDRQVFHNVTIDWINAMEAGRISRLLSEQSQIIVAKENKQVV